MSAKSPCPKCGVLCHVHPRQSGTTTRVYVGDKVVFLGVCVRPDDPAEAAKWDVQHRVFRHEFEVML